MLRRSVLGILGGAGRGKTDTAGDRGGRGGRAGQRQRAREGHNGEGRQRDERRGDERQRHGDGDVTGARGDTGAETEGRRTSDGGGGRDIGGEGGALAKGVRV